MVGLLDGVGGPQMPQGGPAGAAQQQMPPQAMQASAPQGQGLHVLANQLASMQQMIAVLQQQVAELQNRQLNYDLQYQRNEKGQITGATVLQIPDQPQQQAFVQPPNFLG